MYEVAENAFALNEAALAGAFCSGFGGKTYSSCDAISLIFSSSLFGISLLFLSFKEFLGFCSAFPSLPRILGVWPE